MSTNPTNPTSQRTPGHLGQYRPIPHHEDILNDETEIVSPSIWESTKDMIGSHIRSLFIPVLVLFSVATLIFLVVVLIVRPHFGSGFPYNGGSDSDPVIIPPGSKGIWNEIRLPNTIHPIHYDIDLSTILDGQDNSTFFGTVSLALNVTTPTQFFVIHAVGLNLTDISLILPTSNNTLLPIRHEIHVERSYHVFVFPNTLPIGTAQFRTRFIGKMDRSLRGYYLSKYVDEITGLDKWIASTQFESTDARRAFPCMDEPALKATFTITLHTQHHVHALSNMNLIINNLSLYHHDNDSIPFDWWTLTKTFQFATTPRMSTYLVAWVVSDFDSVSSQTKRGVNVSVWTAPGRTAMGLYAARTTALIIDYYEQLLGIEYPLPKSDQIAIPDFAAGAMENWGLITYRDTALLLGPNSTPSNKQRVATVIAHELAHQWFGNLVTLAWWNELYLNEGFANFMEYIGANAAEPTFDMPGQFYRTDQVRAMIADASPHTRPLHAEVKDPAEIEGLFDAISYSKGGSVISMIRHFLESEGHSFFSGIHTYLNDHSYSNARGTDLWNTITSVAGGVNITRLVDEWLTRPGYPIVTVLDVTLENNVNPEFMDTIGRGTVPKNVMVSQQRSMGFSGRNKNLKEQTIWQIPMTYQIWSNRTGKPAPIMNNIASALLVSQQENLPILESDNLSPIKLLTQSEHWVIKLNVGQHGLYRVALPPTMLTTISEWWETDSQLWTPVDRAGIFEDAMDRLMAGDVNVNIDSTLSLLRPLARDSSYTVWSIAIDRLNMMRRLLEREPDFVTIQRVLSKLVDGAVRDLGWYEDPTNHILTHSHLSQESSHVRSLLRSQLLLFATIVGHQETIHQAQVYFDKIVTYTSPTMTINSIVDRLLLTYKESRTRTPLLSSSLLPVVLDTAVRYGNEREYFICENRFRRSTITADALIYLHAMAQTTLPHLVSRNVELALSSAVRGQDKVRFLSWVTMSSPGAPTLVANYLEENWNKFMTLLGRGGAFSSATELIETLAESCASEGDIVRIEELFDPNRRGELPPNTKPAMEKGFASARGGMEWRKLVGRDVVQWFVREAKRIHL